MMNIMRSINTIDICHVSGGAPRSTNGGTPLLNGGQQFGMGGSFNDTMAGYNTFTYDDGSTITTNGRGDVFGHSEIPISSVSIDGTACATFGGAIAGAIASAGAGPAAVISAGVTLTLAGISCYGNSSVTR